mmetsp:Transcript_87934/g.250754  ORF Transcript_87934/g.250754 Transcript_87934/m.250754 type:complete len:299 (-) Transcript_87934:851-1747(-)
MGRLLPFLLRSLSALGALRAFCSFILAALRTFFSCASLSRRTFRSCGVSGETSYAGMAWTFSYCAGAFGQSAAERTIGWRIEYTNDECKSEQKRGNGVRWTGKARPTSIHRRARFRIPTDGGRPAAARAAAAASERAPCLRSTWLTDTAKRAPASTSTHSRAVGRAPSSPLVAARARRRVRASAVPAEKRAAAGGGGGARGRAGERVAGAAAEGADGSWTTPRSCFRGARLDARRHGDRVVVRLEEQLRLRPPVDGRAQPARGEVLIGPVGPQVYLVCRSVARQQKTPIRKTPTLKLY